MTSAAGDPLTEHLIRVTAGPVAAPARPVSGGASGPPVHRPGTHVRAGNAMTRTRESVLRGARLAVAAHGTHVTMTQVAAAAGVAKATLYNHLRTREDVFAALVEHEVRAVVDAVADLPLPAALEHAGICVCEHPVVRYLADREPAVICKLARVDPARGGWARADSAVRGAVGAGSGEAVEVVLRWFAGLLIVPADRPRVRAQARLLARAVTATA